MTEAAGGSRLSPQAIRKLRRAAWIFCGLLSLWLVVSVVWSVIGGIRHDRAVDPFTGRPATAPATPPAETSAP